MTRSVRLLLALLLAFAGVAVAVPASAAPCATAWGSLPHIAPAMSQAPLVAVRTGSHACFDRVVFELGGPVGGWTVEYVDVVTQDGSGAALPVPGGARLQVQLHHPSYDDRGVATYSAPGGPVSGYPVLRSVVNGGSFEGYSTFGVGVRARLPFRVTALAGPGGHSRIVLDVARGWS